MSRGTSCRGRTWPIRGLAFACALGAACVPATDETDPRGGVGVIVTPSAGTRGEPIVTNDGWTIHVDALAAQVFIVAVPQDGKQGGFGGSYLFDVMKQQEFVVRAVPVGTAVTSLTLTRRLLQGVDIGLADPASEHGVDSATAARFDEVPDGIDLFAGDDDDDGGIPAPPIDGGVVVVPGTIARGSPADDPSFRPSLGPSLVMSAHAEKAGRTVSFDLSFNGASPANDISVDVLADALVEGHIEARVESLFNQGDGTLGFDDIARADTDLDGVISPTELSQIVIPPCPKCTDEQKAEVVSRAEENVLSDVLHARSFLLFLPR